MHAFRKVLQLDAVIIYGKCMWLIFFNLNVSFPYQLLANN